MPEHVYDQATYHGVQGHQADPGSRLPVEQTAFGPAERDHARFLREIHGPGHSGFGWGCNGGGTGETAAAIPADALEVDPERFSTVWLRENEVPFLHVDVEHDEIARDRAVQIAGGCRSIPVVVLPNGDVPVEPANAGLAAARGA